MLGVLLAALSSVSYGTSDFTGASASKSTDSAVVTVAAQVVSLLALAVALVLLPPDSWTASDVLWGAAGGVAVAVALTAFYRALAIGPMSTAAAITALVGAIVPFAAGLAFGERPSTVTLLGICLAVPAGVLVSMGGEPVDAQTPLSPEERVARAASAAKTRRLALVAGIGFGLFFVTLSRASAESGLMPLVGARGASIVFLGIALTVTRSWSTIARTSLGFIAITGVLDCTANALYLTALVHGQLTWVAAITSLYPVTTVVLARVVLGERLQRMQLIGLAAAGAALALVAVGR